MTEPLRLPGTMPEPTPQIIALYNLYGLYTNGKGGQRDRAHTALATIHNLLDLADLGNFKVEPAAADGTEPEFISAVIARQSIVLREVAHCIASTERKRQEAIAAIACALGFLQKDEPLSDRARRQTEQTLATWGYQL